MRITVRRASFHGMWMVSGEGSGNWSMVPVWPAPAAVIRGHASAIASDEFIAAAALVAQSAVLSDDDGTITATEREV